MLGACGGPSGGHAAGKATPATTVGAPPKSATPAATIQAYVKAWDHEDWKAMAADVARVPKTFVSTHVDTYRDLGATAISVATGPPVVHGQRATTAVTQTVTIGKLGRLHLHSTLQLQRLANRWLVHWTLTTIDRQLGPGERFENSTLLATRAAITGAGGRALMVDHQQVQVGLVGERLKQVAPVTKLLLAAGAHQNEIKAAVKAARAHPTYFEPVVVISQADYVRHVKGSRLFSIPGTQFEATGSLESATPTLGTYLLGGVGPVTAQQLHQLGPSYGVGDLVGQGGLEEQYQRQLAGTPGGVVTIVDSRGDFVSTIHRFAPRAGRPVRTTISLPVEKAAESAIASTTTPSALVAVQASTGKVLALATHDPTAAADHYEDYALDSAEAPGSTFKTITSTALIEDKGLTLDSSATCPATRTVDGEVFHNDNGEAFGNMTLLTAFAKSCNTAFIGLAASDLTSKQLVAAAKSYDIGTTPAMGFPGYGGDVATPTDRADLASTSIGQGQVTVSPLAMAMVAAAIDSGQVREPRLVAGAPDDTAKSHPVNGKLDADLKTMMAAVVSSGTAAGQGLPPGTHAKTGTAEFGTANPPQTHAWLIGFRGDVAFAAFVNVGPAGGTVAAPLVAKFLDTIGSTAGA